MSIGNAPEHPAISARQAALWAGASLLLMGGQKVSRRTDRQLWAGASLLLMAGLACFAYGYVLQGLSAPFSRT